MWYLRLRAWLTLFSLTFLVGCVAANGTAVGEGRGQDITLQGQFERRTLTANGFGGPESRPARDCYVEVRRDSDDGILASGFLDGNGRGTATIPASTRVYLLLYAQVRVPSATGDSVLQGSVKNARLQARYTDFGAFNQIRNVSYAGGAELPTGTLSATVPASRWEAGAFNIADQMVTFASGVAALEPALRLPNLHAFWSTEYAFTGYPEVAADAANFVLQQQDTRRAIFQFPVRRSVPNGPDAGTDEFNDSVLLESMTHLLFASYSAPETGTSSASILRRDNDLVYVARQFQSEPAVAFVDGFCDLLSGAFRGSRALYDMDDAGRVFPFYLDDHTQFTRVQGQGEFYRGAVAVSLYGIWRNALGGSTPGLQTLWSAARSARGPMEYNNAPLGCYPTYLTGLRSLLGGTSAAWAAAFGELAKEGIGDVTSQAYFSSAALWNPTAIPFSVQGGVRTYAPDKGIFYDRDQAVAYRFTVSGSATRQFTLNLTGGQDLFLEVFGPTGLVGASWDAQASGRRQLVLPVGPGDYLARVRAGWTTADTPSAGFTLSVQ
jgi:hypothetical protein